MQNDFSYRIPRICWFALFLAVLLQGCKSIGIGINVCCDPETGKVTNYGGTSTVELNPPARDALSRAVCADCADLKKIIDRNRPLLENADLPESVKEKIRKRIQEAEDACKNCTRCQSE